MKNVSQIGMKVRIIYHSYNAIAYLGNRESLEYALGYKFKKVYCMKLDKDKIILIPAPHQDKPQKNKCFRAIVYLNRDKYVTIRLSMILMKKIGKPREVTLTIDGDNIVLLLNNEGS